MLPVRFSCAVLLLCPLVIHAGPSPAGTDPALPRPLYSFNQSPLIQIYGLPAPGEARVLGPGRSILAAHLQIANHFTGSGNGDESLHLDGESTRLTLHWRRGLSGGKEWGFELPYLRHGGGFLDGPIEKFHDLFGMPQHGRTDLPRNLVDYRYTREGVDLVRLDRAVDGVGDLRLFAGAQMPAPPDAGYVAAWRLSLKLPTGDDTRLLGSGSTDLAGWVSAATTRPPDRWNLYGGGGLLLMSTGDILPAQQRRMVGFGTLGLSKRFLPRTTFIAQLDVHSPFYRDSRLRQLGSYVAVGLLGIEWEFEPGKFVTLSMSEDLTVGASPDVAFNLSLAVPF